MKTLDYDVVVIGGGPAGLAAALKAYEQDVSVAIFERNSELGGILNQCIHSGFGLSYFKQELTGPEYAESFIDKLEGTNIDVYLNTMIINMDENKNITAVNETGVLNIRARAVVLAMGCRERNAGAIRVPGYRPAGVLTAGQAQRYMNIENLKPGNKAVILGSGDIGLIMARRLTLEGIKVMGVYEIMPYPNGLYRNIKQCLEDFDIPLHLSTTVTKVLGKNRVEGIQVSKVDSSMRPIAGTEETIECDTLLLSVGLIPENELSEKAGVTINPLTNGPVVDNKLETSVTGIFACGNVLHVHDLVDNVTMEAEMAGQKAAEYVREELKSSDRVKLICGEKVRYTVPNYIQSGGNEAVKVSFRVKSPVNGRIVFKTGDEKIYESKVSSLKPSKMEHVVLAPKALRDNYKDITVDIEEAL